MKVWLVFFLGAVIYLFLGRMVASVMQAIDEKDEPSEEWRAKPLELALLTLLWGPLFLMAITITAHWFLQEWLTRIRRTPKACLARLFRLERRADYHREQERQLRVKIAGLKDGLREQNVVILRRRKAGARPAPWFPYAG